MENKLVEEVVQVLGEQCTCNRDFLVKQVSKIIPIVEQSLFERLAKEGYGKMVECGEFRTNCSWKCSRYPQDCIYDDNGEIFKPLDTKEMSQKIANPCDKEPNNV